MKYKKTDAVLYGTAKTITPGVNTCGGDLNTEFSYDVLYTVKDQFTTVTYIDYVSTAIYLMHFLHGGRGVAFGQKATMEDYLDCAFKALFRDQVFFMLFHDREWRAGGRPGYHHTGHADPDLLR